MESTTYPAKNTPEKNELPEINSSEEQKGKIETLSEVYPENKEEKQQNVEKAEPESVQTTDAIETPKIVVKTTNKKFAGHPVDSSANKETKEMDKLEEEVIEQITEIHQLPDAKS